MLGYNEVLPPFSPADKRCHDSTRTTLCASSSAVQRKQKSGGTDDAAPCRPVALKLIMQPVSDRFFHQRFAQQFFFPSAACRKTNHTYKTGFPNSPRFVMSYCQGRTNSVPLSEFDGRPISILLQKRCQTMVDTFDVKPPTLETIIPVAQFAIPSMQYIGFRFAYLSAIVIGWCAGYQTISSAFTPLASATVLTRVWKTPPLNLSLEHRR